MSATQVKRHLECAVTWKRIIVSPEVNWARTGDMSTAHPWFTAWTQLYVGVYIMWLSESVWWMPNHWRRERGKPPCANRSVDTHIHKDSYVHTYQPRRPATTLHTTALGSKKSGQTRKGGKHLLPLKWTSPGGATSQSIKDNKWTKPNYSYVAIHYMFLKTSSVFIQCMKLYNVCMSHTPYIQKFCHLNRCVVKSKYVG